MIVVSNRKVAPECGDAADFRTTKWLPGERSRSSHLTTAPMNLGRHQRVTLFADRSAATLFFIAQKCPAFAVMVDIMQLMLQPAVPIVAEGTELHLRPRSGVNYPM